MGNPNLDRLIESLPDCNVCSPKSSNMIQEQCNSSSTSSTSSSPAPQTPNALDNNDSQENANLVSSGSLKIKILSSTREFDDNNSSEDDPKTPTSMEHKIPVLGTCPPAPRKAMWPSMIGKRKVTYYKVYLDEMVGLNEVAVYVPDIEVGNLGAGSNTKRLKPLPSSAHQL